MTTVAGLVNVKEERDSGVVLVLDIRGKEDAVMAVMGHQRNLFSTSQTNVEEEILHFFLEQCFPKMIFLAQVLEEHTAYTHAYVLNEKQHISGSWGHKRKERDGRGRQMGELTAV